MNWWQKNYHIVMVAFFLGLGLFATMNFDNYSDIVGKVLGDAQISELSVSRSNAAEYEPITVTLHIYGASKPYHNITIYCGKDKITANDYEEDTFTSECVYAEKGMYNVYAEVYDFTYKKIVFDITKINITTTESKDAPQPEEILPPDPLIEGKQGLSNGWILGIIILSIIICSYLYFRWAIPERKRYSEYINNMSDIVERAKSKGHSDSSIHKSFTSKGHKPHHVRKALKKTNKRIRK